MERGERDTSDDHDQPAEPGQQPMLDECHLGAQRSDIDLQLAARRLQIGLSRSLQPLQIALHRGFQPLQIGFCRDAVVDRVENLGGDALGHRAVDLGVGERIGERKAVSHLIGSLPGLWMYIAEFPSI